MNGGLGSTRVAAAQTKGPWLWMSLVMRGWGLGKSLALSRCSEVLPELCLLHLLLFRRWHWSTRVCTSVWTLPLQRTGFGFPSKDRFCGEWFTARLLSAPSAEPKAGSWKSGSPTREQRLTSGVTEWYSCQVQVGSHRHPRLRSTRLTGKHTDGGCCLPSWFLSCLRAATSSAWRHAPLSEVSMSKWQAHVGLHSWSLLQKHLAFHLAVLQNDNTTRGWKERARIWSLQDW